MAPNIEIYLFQVPAHTAEVSVHNYILHGGNRLNTMAIERITRIVKQPLNNLGKSVGDCNGEFKYGYPLMSKRLNITLRVDLVTIRVDLVTLRVDLVTLRVDLVILRVDLLPYA